MQEKSKPSKRKSKTKVEPGNIESIRESLSRLRLEGPNFLDIKTASKILGISYWATYRKVLSREIFAAQPEGPGVKHLIPSNGLLIYLDRLQGKAVDTTPFEIICREFGEDVFQEEIIVEVDKHET